MHKRIGFDNALYIERQTAEINRRIESFEGKLYLEFGGKLFDDYHAARVLPGFDMNVKAKMLQALGDKAEIIICIKAADIVNNKMRADLGITYDLEVMRLMDNLTSMGLLVTSVVITQCDRQEAAEVFRRRLERRGVRVYRHGLTKGYPTDTDVIISDQGYGSNEYIETQRPLVVVTAPGPGSGKLATCLSQLYHEYKRNNRAGYAKFETFPIWNLSIDHPVNVAYEAATSDLNDINMIDPFYLAAEGKTAVNYNRDIAAFPILKTILNKITDGSIYDSPTQMGVNMAGYAIIDDHVCRLAACQEIIRRYYAAECNFKMGNISAETMEKNVLLMKQMGLEPEDRPVVGAALQKAKRENVPVMAIEMPDGEILTGKRTKLMQPCASLVLNAIKYQAHIDDEILLLSPAVLEPIMRLKGSVLHEKDPLLTLEDVLLALSISAGMNPIAEVALQKLKDLAACEIHSSCMLTQTDENALKKLDLRVTCEPSYPTENLYYV